MSFDAFFDDIPAVALASLEREDKNRIEPSTLYLVATPIGNLDDLSLRAIKVLSGVDFIAAEDTRNSARLLAYLGISKPMVSYHEHNRRERGPQIVERLKDGQSCALITDAGTPAISDPGEDLVALCAESGVTVIAVSYRDGKMVKLEYLTKSDPTATLTGDNVKVFFLKDGTYVPIRKAMEL